MVLTDENILMLGPFYSFCIRRQIWSTVYLDLYWILQWLCLQITTQALYK